MDIIVLNKKGQKIKIKKESTDPMCMRASIGGLKKEGYYLVFRGDNLNDIEEMLKETYEAFIEAKKQLELSNLN